jgi:hypothetical protein
MGSERFAAIAASVIMLALALPAPALAQPSAADRETARTLMKKGDEKFAAKDFAGALKDYQAAHAVMQVPTTGLAVAKAQIERGLLIEARETLLSVGRIPADPYESAPLVRARDEAAKLAQRLSDRIPSITITVEGPASGAEVQVDGEAVPPAALGAPRKANPGTHVISATASGYATATANVVIKEGVNEKVALRLLPGRSAPPPPPPVKPVEGGGVSHVTSSSEPGMDAIGRYRKGVHFGISVGPAMAAHLDGGAPLFGGTASFVLNFGITPTFDLRSGVTATFLYDTTDPKWDLTAIVPLMLKVNYTSYLSFSAGLTAGFIEAQGIDWNNNNPLKAYRSGYVVGPEWSPFTMTGGDHRQIELSITQGMRLGNLNKEFHQAVVFTYLFLD